MKCDILVILQLGAFLTKRETSYIYLHLYLSHFSE